MKKIMIFSFLLCHFAINAQYGQDFTAKAPIKLVNNKIIVQLVMNGNDTLDAVFDSSIAHIMFSDDFVKNHHHSFVKHKDYVDVERDCPQITLGDKKLMHEKSYIDVYDIPKWTENTNCVFGINYAADNRIWEINFEHNFMQIHENDTFPPHALIFPLLVSDHEEFMVNHYSCIKLPMQLIYETDTMNTHDPYMLDTGTPDAFIATWYLRECSDNLK